MSKPGAVGKAMQLTKTKTLDTYFKKKDLLNVQPTLPKSKPLAHADKPVRAPRKHKHIPPVENQPVIDKFMLTINEEIALDKILDEPPVVIDETLEREEEASLS
jgi:hypothetical protein